MLEELLQHTGTERSAVINTKNITEIKENIIKLSNLHNFITQ